jgi:hypothetical protein
MDLPFRVIVAINLVMHSDNFHLTENLLSCRGYPGFQ